MVDKDLKEGNMYSFKLDHNYSSTNPYTMYKVFKNDTFLGYFEWGSVDDWVYCPNHIDVVTPEELEEWTDIANTAKEALGTK